MFQKTTNTHTVALAEFANDAILVLTRSGPGALLTVPATLRFTTHRKMIVFHLKLLSVTRGLWLRIVRQHFTSRDWNVPVYNRLNDNLMGRVCSQVQCLHQSAPPSRKPDPIRILAGSGCSGVVAACHRHSNLLPILCLIPKSSLDLSRIQRSIKFKLFNLEKIIKLNYLLQYRQFSLLTFKARNQ